MSNTNETPVSTITSTPLIGQKAETRFEADGVTPVSHSTLANEGGDLNRGLNTDYKPSDGKTLEEQQAIGKGANPGADVVTKNNTTVGPVFIEPSPSADGETVPFTAAASLPVNTQITEPDGTVHAVGEDVAEPRATSGTLVDDGGTPEVVGVNTDATTKAPTSKKK